MAEARLKSTQEQLGKANDAAVAAQDKVQELKLALEVSSGDAVHYSPTVSVTRAC